MHLVKNCHKRSKTTERILDAVTSDRPVVELRPCCLLCVFNFLHSILYITDFIFPSSHKVLKRGNKLFASRV